MFSKTESKLARFALVGVLSSAVVTTASAQTPAPARAILEAFPDSVQASIENHQKQLAIAAQSVTSVPSYLLVPTLNRWQPGSAVRVAFSGGDSELRSRIEDAANEWTKPGIANIKFQFRDATGKFLEWSATDPDFRAEIRVAFGSGNGGGYWSHVGRDSINRDMTGGRPGEASLNLDSFDQGLPPDWRAVVIHEFGHALGFQHEHQNPVGGCDFRFEDDAGYVQTKDAQGWFITDPNGHRPGLYTLLGGYKNYWPRAKVDFNLKALQVSSAYLVGQFDKLSIMKYFFGAFMFAGGENSPCYTNSENLVLSAQDKEGARKAYSFDAIAIAATVLQKKQVLGEILTNPRTSAPFQSNIRSQLQQLQ
jgi:hypothetical protein